MNQQRLKHESLSTAETPAAQRGSHGVELGTLFVVTATAAMLTASISAISRSSAEAWRQPDMAWQALVGGMVVLGICGILAGLFFCPRRQRIWLGLLAGLIVGGLCGATVITQFRDLTMLVRIQLGSAALIVALAAWLRLLNDRF